MLTYSVNVIDGARTLILSGSLTAETTEVFTSIVERVTQKESMIVNFENVGLVTAAGLNSLVDVSFFAKDHGSRVIVLWPNKELLDMAQTFGVYRHIIFADTIDEAKMKIKHFI